MTHFIERPVSDKERARAFAQELKDQVKYVTSWAAMPADLSLEFHVPSNDDAAYIDMPGNKRYRLEYVIHRGVAYFHFDEEAELGPFPIASRR